ncbi:MAG: EVE domain-containing protein [Bacteroidia bacterium]|nr:EVE domain-containing protein [Bacteroidia bacterium]
MNYWLMKSEPFIYSWQQLMKDGKTCWDGVRNYLARNNMKSMKKGDLALFYHSNEGLEVAGVMEIIKEAYPDPTTTETAWVAVDVRPVKSFSKPVSLKQMKADPKLQNMEMFRLNRLSVCKLTKQEFVHICKLGGISKT